MIRNTLIEKLTEKVNGMSEEQLEQLLGLACIISEAPAEKTLENIEDREQELEELEEAAREVRRANLRKGEKAVDDQIQRGRTLIREDMERRDLQYTELEYLLEVSYGSAWTEDTAGRRQRIFGNDPARLAGDAYKLGFTKGYVASVSV